MGLGDADATLAPWLRSLDDAECLYKGDCRGDGLASIQWRRSFSNELWMRVKAGSETSVETARLVEFLLLLDKLAATQGGILQLSRWTNGYAGYARPRYANCCMGMCHNSSDEADPVPLSVVNPCSRHSTAWQSNNGDKRVVVGVVVDCVGEFDAELFALLESAAANPFTTPTLSADFRRVYRELEDMTDKNQLPQSAVRIHVRLSKQDQSPASVKSLAQMMSVWGPRNSDHPLAVVGVDLHSSVLRDVVAVAEKLPFRQLLVCASACSSGYRATPPTKKCDPIDDTTLRHIITKSQRFLQELELCNVHLASFACLTNGVTSSSCRLRKLRLREFAMSATSDGGIFASLKDTSHPLYHTLEELEISQTMDSAGGLSFWLEREAGEMLLMNDRLARCVIHQSCAIQPASTHRGFRQTRGQELRTPLLLSSKLAFLGSMPTHLPRDVNAHIMELAGHRTKRYTAMHYQIVDTDKLSVFVEDCKAWTHNRFAQVSNLPCGSYYF